MWTTFDQEGHVDPMSGEKVIDRSVLTFKDDKTMLLEAWRVMPDRQEVKMMEITSTRR